MPDLQGGWPTGSGRRQPRAPRRITASYLERSALHHLERFPTSAANLRRVLGRRADKSCAHHESDRDEAQLLIEQVIARLVERGLLDDRRYAADQARRLRGRGASTRRIHAWLASRGVSAEVCEEVLRGDTGAEVEQRAAWTLARRRRIGPYRSDEERPERRERDLAILARGGFSFGVATQVIDATAPPEDG